MQPFRVDAITASGQALGLVMKGGEVLLKKPQQLYYYVRIHSTKVCNTCSSIAMSVLLLVCSKADNMFCFSSRVRVQIFRPRTKSVIEAITTDHPWKYNHPREVGIARAK